MNENHIFDAISAINDDALQDAKSYKKARSRVWVRWCAVAASLILVISVIALPVLFSGNSSNSYHAPLFVITAHAADAQSTELEVNQNCFSSGPAQGNIFGVDMPIFDLSIEPGDWDNRGNISSTYELEISYNGKVIQGKDDHILVSIVVPIHGTDGVSKYMVSGWFEEPTDLTVAVKERASGKTVETMTVHIRYCEEENGYETTLVDVDHA